MVAYFSSKNLKRFQATLTVALLFFCLLGTHWVGFGHSISHAGLHSHSVEKCSADDSAAGITHSSDTCHLFDALTLAGFVPVASTDVVGHSDLLSSMIASVDLILAESSATVYQSRAPPSFIL